MVSIVVHCNVRACRCVQYTNEEANANREARERWVGPAFLCLFFYSGPHRTARCCPRSRKAVYFTESTDSNAHLIQKHPRCHVCPALLKHETQTFLCRGWLCSAQEQCSTQINLEPLCMQVQVFPDSQFPPLVMFNPVG